MKRTRILAYVLCVALLAATFTAFPVAAESAESVVTWDDLVNGMHLASKVDFATAGTVVTKESDGSYPSNTIEQAKAKGVLSIAENGAMTLEDTMGTGWGVAYRPSTNILANLKNDGFMHFSFTYGEAGKESGQIKMSTGSKMMHMVFAANSVIIYGDNETVAFPNHTAIAGKTYDYIVKTDGNVWRFWSKASDETAYTYAGSSALKASSLANELYMFPNSGISVHKIEFYEQGEPDPEPDPDPDPSEPGATTPDSSSSWEELVGDLQSLGRFNFSFGSIITKESDGSYPSNTIEQAKTKGVLSIAENGAMTLKDVTGTGWGVAYRPSSNLLANLGTDGLMHFSITYGESGKHKGQMKLSSGTKMLHMVFEDAQVVVYGESNDHVVFPNHSSYPGKTYDYVVKTDGSSYQFWSKESSETAYTYAGISALKSSGLANEIYMFANNQITINSIEFYGMPETITAAIAGNRGTVTLAATEVNHQLDVTASILIGSESDEFDRRATVIGAVYNKEHGYTIFAAANEFDRFVPGVAKTLESSFAIDAGIDMSQAAIGAMVWDSVETGIPLGDAFGAVPGNKAKGTPTDTQKDNPGLTATVKYNEVILTGYIGKSQLTSAIIKNGAGEVKAIGQARANENGMVEYSVAIDPYTNNGGTYTLLTQYGSEVVDTQNVRLYCVDDLENSRVTDKASFVTFVSQFGTEAEKDAIEDETFLTAAFNKFVDMGGTETGDSFDFFGAPTMVSKAISNEQTERSILVDVNEASLDEDVYRMETLLLTTYGDYLGINASTVAEIKSTKNLFNRMLKTTYLDIDQIKIAFQNALTAQKEAEAGSNTQNGTIIGGTVNGGGFGGGGAGGGFAGGGASVSGEKTPETELPVVGTVGEGISGEFADLDSVPWAKESIFAMKRKNILSGDGSGCFYPNQSITREEFLKIVMNALNIPTSTGECQFVDVDMDAWYAPYVIGAYKSGIITGISEDRFGIGENIIRADMAVILVRAMEKQGYHLDGLRAAMVFSDFDLIPQYAERSISLLYEAELMNGVGENNFAPLNNTTRAEAAVGIHRVYEYIRERQG